MGGLGGGGGGATARTGKECRERYNTVIKGKVILLGRKQLRERNAQRRARATRLPTRPATVRARIDAIRTAARGR